MALSTAESRLNSGLLPVQHGFKSQVFLSGKAQNDSLPLGTDIVTADLPYSLICPISVLGVSGLHVDTDSCLTSTGVEYGYGVVDVVGFFYQFHVHHIDRGLKLAPSGKWSRLNWELDRNDLVSVFVKGLEKHLGLEKFKAKTYWDAVNMLLANLLAVHNSSSQLLLSRRSGKHKNNNPAGIDNRVIKTVADYLADQGFINLYVGRPNDADKNSSWCVPLPSLIAAIDRYDAKIRLHEKTQLAVVRDADDNAIPMYTNKKKRLALARYGQPVKRHYETWLSHTATLDGRYLLPWLRRLFNRNMDLGGRFYGDYQNIPSADRKRILIDGERTVELDYASIHVALLYARKGLPLNGDAYVVDGHERSTFKSICLKLINAENEGSLKAIITTSGKPKTKQAVKEYKEKRQQYDHDKVLNPNEKEPHKSKPVKNFIDNIPDGAKGEELLAILKDRHHPIREFFHGQNIGLKLQKDDSELMANVLTKLDGIPCLPVHDSIRCRVSDMEQVTNAMIDAFKELHSQNIVITNDLVVSS